ncbi:hypothetical protein OQ618_14255 [Escherichia coli]|uniref:hypothetical protein n=1 Tax=Escherichia coli TaxID=562 RepID=UPI0022503F94|nr:hypothetical protein [Escherichia coli]MCX3352716.1 hypothetical protein [Escherichia coli]
MYESTKQEAEISRAAAERLTRQVNGLTQQVDGLSKQLEGLSLIHISEPTRHAQISFAVFCLKIGGGGGARGGGGGGAGGGGARGCDEAG